MKRFCSPHSFIIFGIFAWFVIFGCRTTDLVAMSGSKTSTPLPTRTIRPTFTPAPPTLIPPTQPPPPTVVVVRPSPTVRRVPTRTPIPPPPVAPVIPPTPDPQAAYYFKFKILGCVPGDNTRIQGSVTDNGKLVNGITVRVAADPDGPAVVEQMTGTDPSDHRHIDPALTGKYRLGIAEGARTPGNWWVFIVSTDGNAETAKALIHTDEWAGCNIATIDWAH